MALRNGLASECFLFVFLLNPETLSLHKEEEWREQDGFGETSSCICCGAVLCIH